MTTIEGKTLESVVPLLGRAYVEWKEWEKAKNDYRDVFFAFANEKIEQDGLAIKLVDIVAPSEEIAIERAKLHHPGWLIDTHRPHRLIAGQYEIILIEDPTLMPFAYEHEGVKYARTIRKGAVMVDDDWLKAEDPDLYEAVTYQLPWGRIMIPVEHLDEERLGQLGKYIYSGSPRVSLAPPRAIGEEE